MRSIYDNFTVRIGDTAEINLEDGRYLHIKGHGPEETSEVFIDTLEELDYEDQKKVTETFHEVCMMLRDMAREVSKNPEMTHHETMSHVERVQETPAHGYSQQVKLIQVKQTKKVQEKPVLLN